MKSKAAAILLILVLAFCGLLVLGLSNKAKPADQPKMTLNISPLKTSYVLGEVVSLDIKVTNIGDSDVFLRGWTAQSGLIKFLVSREDQEFKQYDHSAWIRDHKSKAIKPGETRESKATLLWNFSPARRFVNPAAFDYYIMSDLAFPEPGVYFIKAVLVISASVPGQNRAEVESTPVQIVINEPVGEDKKVWNQIKENTELAYFIQQGEPRSPKPEEQEKLVKEVEQIIADNPNSNLANQMREGLEKHRENEAKIKEFMENLKRRQKPSN